MKISKKLLAVVSAMCVASVTSVVAFAESSANQAVVDAMTTTAGDMVATGTAIIPVALTVIGLSLVVVFGVKLFKKIASKG